MNAKRYSEIKEKYDACKNQMQQISYLVSLGEKEIAEFYEYDRKVKQKEKEEKYKEKYKDVKNFSPTGLGL